MGYSRPWQIHFFAICQGLIRGARPWQISLFCHLPGVDPGCMTLANSLFLPFARGDGVLPTLANPIFHCLPGYNRVFSPLANVLFPIYQGIHHTLSQSCLFNKIGSSRRFLFAPIEKSPLRWNINRTGIHFWTTLESNQRPPRCQRGALTN